MVDQRSFLTVGIKTGRREKSGLSWRAAVTMMVQKSRGEVSYTVSAVEAAGRRMGKEG